MYPHDRIKEVAKQLIKTKGFSEEQIQTEYAVSFEGAKEKDNCRCRGL